MEGHPGYSLLELLVTVTLIGAMLAVSVPLFRQSINSSRVTAEVNRLVRAVHVAKSEAVKTSGEVVICPSRDGRQCAQELDAWQAGWLAYFNADRDSPPAVDPGERILMSRQLTESLRARANRKAFVFHGYAKRSTNGTVVFCTGNPASDPLAVVVSYTGRPRSARRRSDGKTYACDG